MSGEYMVDIDIWDGDEVVEQISLGEGEIFEAGRLGIQVKGVNVKTIVDNDDERG